MKSGFVCLEKFYEKHATTKFGNSPRRRKSGRIGSKYLSISDEGGLFGSLSLNFGIGKVCSMKSTLSNLQNDFLREFFSHENRIDSPEEIMANKLCTLLSRSEIRDLVDVHELEKAGFDLEAALLTAQKKDAGLSPAQLSWVLDQIRLGDDLILPGDISVSELREYLLDLTTRLKRLAFPT